MFSLPIELEHNILEHIADSIIITNQGGEIIYANPAFLRLYSYEIDDILFRNPSIIKSGDLSEIFYRNLWSSLHRGRSFEGLCKNITKNGDIVYEKKSFSVLRDKNNLIIGYISVGRDVTKEMELKEIADDRSRRVERLLSKEQYLRRVLERIAKINEIIISNSNIKEIINKSSNILSQQQQYILVVCALKNRESGELEVVSKYGSAYHALPKRFDVDFFLCKEEFTKDILISNRCVVIENFERFKKLGKWISKLNITECNSFVSLPLSMEQLNEPLGALVIFSKNSEFLKKEIKFLNDISRTLALAIKTSIDKELLKQRGDLLVQQSKLATMGEMISAIAHQWRQPLNGISGILANLSDKYEFANMSEEDFYSSIKEINFLLKHLSQTIEDFRNFFKPDKKNEIFDIEEVSKEAIRIIKLQLERSQIEIKITKLSSDSFLVDGYQNEYKQVILNFITNSKDAIVEKREMIQNSTPSRDRPYIGEIELTFNQDEKYHFIEIKDNGRGIDKESIPRIYEPYFTTKKEGVGTGIGLYMSKMIIQKSMNGDIELKNRKNPTIFLIKLSKNCDIKPHIL